LLKFTDTGISDFSPKSKEYFFPLKFQEMLGAGPLTSLDRISARNGTDLSQYATL
jgi:hypothetical protein